MFNCGTVLEDDRICGFADAVESPPLWMMFAGLRACNMGISSAGGTTRSKPSKITGSLSASTKRRMLEAAAPRLVMEKVAPDPVKALVTFFPSMGWAIGEPNSEACGPVELTNSFVAWKYSVRRARKAK